VHAQATADLMPAKEQDLGLTLERLADEQRQVNELEKQLRVLQVSCFPAQLRLGTADWAMWPCGNAW
jgi:hypothetical protein